MQARKLVFAGTPEFSAWHLQALLDSRHDVLAVYTQPDRASGRGKKLQASPVKRLALEHGLAVHQPPSLKPAEARQQLADIGADLMVVVAYGLILPPAILDTPPLGCINVHASLLPRWRGAAPIERALLAGDRETGVTIMQMDAGLDTGDMLYRLSTPIAEDDNRQMLEARLGQLGCEALVHCLDHFDSLRASAEPQDDSLATYARKLDKADARLDWSDDARQLHRQIRAGVDRQPAFSFLDGLRIRLLAATVPEQSTTAEPGSILAAGAEGIDIACGTGVLRIQQLQLPGKKALPVRDVLNSRRELFQPGQQFRMSDGSDNA